MVVPPDKFEVYRQIVERAWSDPAFKAKLIAHPREVFEEYGIQVSESESIEVIQGNPSPDQFFLPGSDEGFIC